MATINSQVAAIRQVFECRQVGLVWDQGLGPVWDLVVFWW